MAGRTLVGRAGGDSWKGGRETEVRAWLVELDLDPARFARQLAVTRTGETYELHLTEYLLDDEHGVKYLDWAAQEPATRPLVVPVPAGRWPAWLTGLNVLS